MDFKSKKADQPITEDAFAHAAEDLACDIAAIKAVAEVESRGDGFLDDGRPKILFERHKFRNITRGRYNGSHPEISGPPGNYSGGAKEYERLEQAMALDREAALLSASWGKFQIMGFNHQVCGFNDIEAFVAAMVESENSHLEAFVGFVEANHLDRHLRALDWARFARGYNGPAYRKNNYHVKIAQAYEKYASQAPADPGSPVPETPSEFRISSVGDLQTALDDLGISPGIIDNKMGPDTRSAIEAFQRFARLPVTGAFDAPVRAAVQAAYHMRRKLLSPNG
ncbi:MAG: DUF3380 domain-containing protein [Desulfobacter sp.]|nr:MAG: DUF3380 domain-containing protein [Desulfobacter sp.]